jgi:ABC-2 type transport system ATP-binding protein
MEMTDYAIEVEDVSRSYRRQRRLFGKSGEVVALRDVSFRVPTGSILGLLGPNGAGKTTLVRVLSTLLLPSRGKARIVGLDVVEDVRAVRKKIGIVFGGDRGLYDRLSGVENLRYFADLYEVDYKSQRARIEEVLDLVGLTERASERVETYSRGMKQRLHLARGILHRPSVLLLDEPTIGVDPVGARALRALVSEVNSGGTTILLTTHYMHEAEFLCDTVSVICDGSLLVSGSPTDLAQLSQSSTVLELEVFGASHEHLRRVRAIPGVAGVAVQDRGPAQNVRVTIDQGAELTGIVLAEFQEAGVGRVAARSANLEDAYVSLVGGRE